jgi:hypothetical protein
MAKSKQSGLEIRDIFGDVAYSENENIGYAKENYNVLTESRFNLYGIPFTYFNYKMFKKV